jgi:hypothetical protein
MATAFAPLSVNAMPSADGLLSRHAYFLHWGVIQISLTNFIIIVLMLVVFALALVLPFPQAKSVQDEEGHDEH